MLRPDIAGALSAERFEREIQVAARLQHPHIVPLLTAGDAGDLLYYTMPFVEGETLRGRLGREGRLPLADARGLVADAELRLTRGAGDAFEIACAYHWLGDDTTAFEWLERSFLAREFLMTWLHRDPRLRRLHGDSRFESLLGRVGVAPRATAPTRCPLAQRLFQRNPVAIVICRLTGYRRG